MFISLLVITQYGLSGYIKAADDPDASWNQAVQNIANWQQQVLLYLSNNQIQAIPDNLNLPRLEQLYLSNNQIQAIPNNLNLLNLQELRLSNNQIQAIPNNLNLLNLRGLYLSNNRIDQFDPNRLLAQFPHLAYLELSDNPLDPQNIQDLRDAADKADRNIEIIANNINPPRPEGEYIKGD